MGEENEMPPIETIARPVRNRISVKVPKEYASYSFQVLLVPLIDSPTQGHMGEMPHARKGWSFVDALLSCPKLDEGEELDIARNACDVGRVVDL